MQEPGWSEHLGAVSGAMAGGFVWGLARIYVAAFSPTPPRKREIAAALVESTFAIATAGIGGYYVAPAAVKLTHIHTPETQGLLTVVIGLMLWQSIPVIRWALGVALGNALATRLGIKPQSPPPEPQQ